MSIVEQTRGEKFLRPVACRVLSREEIGAYVKSRIESELEPCELAYEGVVLRALGMLPEDYDYPKAVHAIYEAALGGFYDPASKTFSMADWTVPLSQKGVAVHELVHALQDQRWDLERFVDSKRLSGDEVLARMGLVEGEAVALVLDAERRASGAGPLPRSLVHIDDGLRGGFAAPFSPDYPDALQQLVQFPYTAGLRFVLGVIRDGGYEAIDDAFRKPPRSTEELLHAEKWAQEEVDFTIPALRVREEGWGGSVYTDTLGEFAIRVLLREKVRDPAIACEAAHGWGGDRAQVFNHPSRKGDSLILWQVYWDTNEDAAQFLKAFLGPELQGLGKPVRLSPARTLTAKRLNTPANRPALEVRVHFHQKRQACS